MLNNRPDKRVRDAFTALYADWPRGQYPTNRGKAEGSFVEAASRHGLDRITQRCREYIDKYASAPAGSFPVGMTRFLSELDSGSAGGDINDVADPAAEPEFVAAYAKYPDFKGKAANSATCAADYLRLVPVDFRLNFYAAVVAYAEELRDADGEVHSLGFRRFLGRWREQECVAERLGDLLAPAFAERFEDELPKLGPAWSAGKWARYLAGPPGLPAALTVTAKAITREADDAPAEKVVLALLNKLAPGGHDWGAAAADVVAATLARFRPAKPVVAAVKPAPASAAKPAPVTAGPVVVQRFVNLYG